MRFGSGTGGEAILRCAKYAHGWLGIRTVHVLDVAIDLPCTIESADTTSPAAIPSGEEG